MLSQKEKSEKRRHYIEQLKQMSLKQRIKDIANKQPYGLCGIPEDLYELSNIKNVFADLDENTRNNFFLLVQNRKERFFRNLLNEIKI